MIYALVWIIMITSWWFPPLLVLTIPLALFPILVPAGRLLMLLDPEVSADSHEVRQEAAGQVACIWVATLAISASPPVMNEISIAASGLHLLAGLAAVWKFSVPLKRLPTPRILSVLGLVSQSLWFVFCPNVMKNFYELGS